jgi:A/G-specific adenine glycosylase
LIRPISSVLKCCSSIAIGPEHPIVRVPCARRCGVVASARIGPTIPGQASKSWPTPGAARLNASFATEGTTDAIDLGPWTDRETLGIRGCVSLAILIPTAGFPKSGGFPAGALLTWYDRNRRRLPWRAEPGRTPDPYRVWLSEIMLQQTTVAAVIPYYEAFVSRFPTVEALAAADLDEVLGSWAGLGYYARARNLHACARVVAARGGFPGDIAGLLELPGIGPYTAAAVASIGFGVPAVPIDGNVERVTARLFALTDPLPVVKPAIRAAADRLGQDPDAISRPSDFAQALFDLGATICSPTSPACALCPWMEHCEARRLGIERELPRRAPKKERPSRHGVHFWLSDAMGNVLLRRRPASGLLGGMVELPGTSWRGDVWAETEAMAFVPMEADWRPAGQVRHGFTHFQLTIDLFAARVERIEGDGFVHPVTRLDEVALPSVMRKCVATAGG